MTLEEIYDKAAQNMIKGMMVHEQLADYYDFLGLHGYKRCHEYHFIEESLTFRCFSRYYINHYHKLVTETHPTNPKVIPESWYRYTSNDVDTSTRKAAVRTGMTTWVEWEESTKNLYNELIVELHSIGDVTSMNKFTRLLKCVDHELKKANRKMQELKAVDFNIDYIMSEQKCIHDKYKKLIRRKA